MYSSLLPSEVFLHNECIKKYALSFSNFITECQQNIKNDQI